jgi:ATP-dependent DNA helicase RecG
LTEKHSSKPFNPDIANAFFRAGEIESWGRGVERILTACREAKCPPPEIDYTPGDFWFKFPFRSEYVAATITEPILVKTLEKTLEKTPVKILQLLKEKPDLTLAELAVLIGKSASAIERASAKLVKAGELRRIGPDKGGFWEVAGKSEG